MLICTMAGELSVFNEDEQEANCKIGTMRSP